MKVLKGNICKCSCGAFLQYNDNDIKEVEKSYGIGTYAGETYIAKMITCPICLKEIEIYK